MPAAATSRAPTGATRWRGGGLGGGEGCAAGAAPPPGTVPSAGVGPPPPPPSPPPPSHDLSFPFELAKRKRRSLYVPAARAEEKMTPTLEGEFARKRRMMAGLWDIVVGEGMLQPP